jgi:hypothetical protein
MGLIDLNPFKPVVDTGSDANLFRNAFDAIQALFNGGLDATNLAAGAAIKKSQMSTVLADAPSGTELRYAEQTSNLSITATTEGSGAGVGITTAAYAFDGATPVMIQVQLHRLDRGTTNIQAALYDGGVSIGLVGISATTGNGQPFRQERRITPTSGSHTYTVGAWVDAGTGAIIAGAGGSGANQPSFIRIVKA